MATAQNEDEKAKQLRDSSKDLARNLHRGHKKHTEEKPEGVEISENGPRLLIDLMPNNPTDELLTSETIQSASPDWFWGADQSMNIGIQTSVKGVVTRPSVGREGTLNQFYIGENGHIAATWESLLAKNETNGQFVYLLYGIYTLMSVLRLAAPYYKAAGFDGPLELSFKYEHLEGHVVFATTGFFREQSAKAVLDEYQVTISLKPDEIADFDGQKGVAMKVADKLYKQFGLEVADTEKNIDDYFKLRGMVK